MESSAEWCHLFPREENANPPRTNEEAPGIACRTWSARCLCMPQQQGQRGTCWVSVVELSPQMGQPRRGPCWAAKCSLASQCVGAHTHLIPYWFWAHRPQGLGAIVPGGGALGLTQAQGPLVAHWQSGKSPIGQQATSQP